MLAFDVGPKTYDKDMWMIYSTTSNHMTPYDKYFTTLDPSHKAWIKFIFGDGIMSQGIGDVVIITDKGKKTIKNVLFCSRDRQKRVECWSVDTEWLWSCTEPRQMHHKESNWEIIW